MSEPKADYQVAVEVELTQLLSTSQLALLAAQLREIIERGYGEVAIRIEGDRVYIIPAISINAGRLPNR